MTGELNETVTIPVWFVKLGGYLCSGVLVFVVSWAGWVTITLFEHSAQYDRVAEMATEVKNIDSTTRNMQRSIDGIVARMKWEQEQTTQTKLP